MKPQFDQKLVSSFYLWFENKLLSDSVLAYQTGVPNTYQYVDAFDIPTGYYAYQGQYRQLVAENQVSVPNSGIFVGNSFVSGGQSNIYTDFNNGRIIVPYSSGKNLQITSTSTVKEINVYLTNDSPEQVLLESDFFADGELIPKLSETTKKLDEKTYYLPACFIFPVDSENKEFALGGEEETTSNIKVMVLSKDNFSIDSVLSVFRDLARSCIPLIEYEDFPYGKFFSLKEYPYKYSDLAANSTEKSFIQKIIASRVSKSNKRIQIGFLDFDISTYRFPRS